MTTDPSLHHSIQPQPIFPISTADTEVTLFAENQIIINAAIRERLKPYQIRRRRFTRACNISTLTYPITAIQRR